jgi:hypothetical protein
MRLPAVTTRGVKGRQKGVKGAKYLLWVAKTPSALQS